jgi:WD40 repeat protein
MSREAVSVSVSPDGAAFAIAFPRSFHVFSVLPVQLRYEKEFDDRRILALSTVSDGTFVALSTVSSDVIKVILWNTVYGDMHCQVDLPEPVTSLLLHQNFLYVVLSSSVRLYAIQSLSLAVECFTTANPKGVAAICPAALNPRIAMVGDTAGSVAIRQLDSGQTVSFHAAKHPLSLLRFSQDGSLIATASQQGTLIRVFETQTGHELSVFRRGALKSKIRALSFSPSNQRLVAASSNGTVHLFAADSRVLSPQDAPRALSKVKVGRPKMLDAAFANDHLVVVVGSDGSVYSINCTRDGFCGCATKLVFE